MTELEVLDHEAIVDLLKKQNEISYNKKQIGYNLFTISTYNSHYENFHSDIIASLLDPVGLHNEGYSFLELFIHYINRQLAGKNIVIEATAYKNTSVLREKGRIDIWIRDESSKKSIIIENKINDAPDRTDQLLDYFEYARSNGYETDLIIYLSKDGTKINPAQTKMIEKPILNIAAFRNDPSDLVNGWLSQCLVSCTNNDSNSFIYQYLKLLKHLTNSHMNDEIKEAFYQFVSEHRATDTIHQLKTLIDELPNYRAERFCIQAKEFDSPFGRMSRYQNNYWLFENYITEDGNYKLDVFFENSGNAKVVLWNTSLRNDEGYKTVEALLHKIKLKERFNGVSRYNGYTAEFNLSETYPNIEAIDIAVVDLVKLIFVKLKQLPK